MSCLLWKVILMIEIILSLQSKILHEVEKIEDLPLFAYNLKDNRISIKFDLVRNRILLLQRGDTETEIAPFSTAFKGNLDLKIQNRKLNQFELDLLKPDEDPPEEEATPAPIPENRTSRSGITTGILTPKNNNKLDEIGAISPPPELIILNSNSSSSAVNFSSNDSFAASNSYVGSRPEFEDVFGTDDREIVGNTEAFPIRTIGRLFFMCANGAGTCTGTLIGPRTVMTAAHCIQSIRNGICTDFSFTPGQQQDYLPYSTVNVVDAEVKAEWIQNNVVDNDYAVMTLERDLGDDVGWMGFGYSCTETLQDLFTAGYPSDLDESTTTMYQTTCPQTSLNACPCQIYPEGACLLSGNSFYHQCDTFKGQSGSPMWVYVTPEYPQIRAIHSHGFSGGRFENQAVYINDQVYNFYKSYMEST